MTDWLVIGSGLIANGIMRITPNAMQMRRPDHDIRTIDRVPSTSQGVAVICAAVSGIRQCDTFSQWSHEINVEHTLRVGKLLREHGWNVIMLSSQAALHPTTEYGQQKKDVEDAWTYGPILRLPKILHRDHPVICSWKHDLSRGRPIYAYTDASIQPITVADAVEAMRVASTLRFDHVLEAPGEPTTWYDLAYEIIERIGYDVDLLRPQNGGVTHRPLDGKGLRSLGWKSPTREDIMDTLA
ncbi:MAG: NAD-dependent epimerase/dehydratase family protein [Ilumatobacteraceae bacterium]